MLLNYFLYFTTYDGEQPLREKFFDGPIIWSTWDIRWPWFKLQRADLDINPFLCELTTSVRIPPPLPPFLLLLGHEKYDFILFFL